MKKIVILVAVLFSFLLSSCMFFWPMGPGPEGHGHSEHGGGGGDYHQEGRR